MFKEPLAVTMRANRTATLALIQDPAQRERFERDHPESNLPPLPKKREPRADGVDIDRIHRKQPPPLEADVLTLVADLLQAHPLVRFAVRQNSGAASYEAKSGRYAPIFFYKWIKCPEPVTLPDVWGMLTSGRFFFFELKRPGWTKPTDDRERKQAAFLEIVRKGGALAAFVTDAEQIPALIA